MRTLHVAAFVSLDGVMQAPGGPDEDRIDDPSADELSRGEALNA